MRVSVSLQGSDDLRKRLLELPKALSTTVQRKALIAGAEPIRAHAASLAPRDPMSSGPHLADNIVIGVPPKRKLAMAGLSSAEADVAGEGGIVEVGPALQPSDHFYGYLQEFGTVRHQAQPFMRPAFDTQARASLNLVLSSLWTAIRKALPQTFPSGRSSTSGGL
jgi:HK97 gp10 family phage protein